jgi:hypothetical protein
VSELLDLDPLYADAPPTAGGVTAEAAAPIDLTGELADYTGSDGIEVGVRLAPEPFAFADPGPQGDQDPLAEITADPPSSDAGLAPSDACEEAGGVPGTASAAEEPDADDRRASRRAAYARKVPAFGTRALRVLVGRDLSCHGMRIERFPELEIGDRLHLAIYGEAGEEPFLVWATVNRDDAEEGMGLVFDEVQPLVAEQLEKLVASLPAVESLRHGELGNLGSIVGEILEH